jgi:hypothetical protein
MSPVLRIFHPDGLFIPEKACVRSTLKSNICLDGSEICVGQHMWILTVYNRVFDITDSLGFITPKS